MAKRLCFSICVFLFVLAVFPSLIWCQSNDNSEILQSDVLTAELRLTDRPAVPVLKINSNKSKSGVQTDQQESLLDPLALILLISGLGILTADKMHGKSKFLR